MLKTVKEKVNVIQGSQKKIPVFFPEYHAFSCHFAGPKSVTSGIFHANLGEACHKKNLPNQGHVPDTFK